LGCAWFESSADRAAAGPGTCLRHGAFDRGDRRDHRHPRRHGEAAHVSRAREVASIPACARRSRRVREPGELKSPMNRIENTAAEHREIGELLPWFVNGRLSEADRQRVDAHLRLCEACSDELAAQRRIYGVMSVDAGVERMPVAGLNRLRTRIESLDDAVPAPAE